MAYDVRGDPNGRPCFWFHGSPSCRLEAVLLDGFGRAHGHRFIATDRPGIGGSSPSPGWTLSSFCLDVVALADHLDLSRFSVAGGSGGGPFVLAMASVAPTRIDRAVSLACAGAFEHEALRAHIGWVDRLTAWVAPMPLVLPMYFGSLGLVSRVPPSVVQIVTKTWPGSVPGGDSRLVEVFMRTLREATAQGSAGVVEDTKVLHRPWGFELGSIGIDIDFVNGTKDEFVPFAYGEELAARIPRARVHKTIDADHFHTIFDTNRLEQLLG